MIALLVKCKCHGIQIERDTAYKAQIGKINHYYCSKEEYEKTQFQKQVKDDVFQFIYQIFGYKVTNTTLYSEITAISDSFGYETIHMYLKDNQEFLNKSMSKEFQSEYAKIRYLAAILKNNIADYKSYSAMTEVSLPAEIFKPIYCSKPRRKPLAYYEK